MSAFAFGCRCLLIGVFAVSVVGKVRGTAAFREFARSLVDMGLVSNRWSAPVAAAVTAAEFAVVVLLGLPMTVAAGFLAATALLVALTAGLTRSVRRGAGVPCRCFGRSKEPVGWGHVVRNGVLLAVAVAGGAATLAAPGTPGPAAAALAFAVAAVGVIAVVFFDDLKFLFTGPAAPASRR